MGKRLNEVQREIHHKKNNFVPTPEHIRVNGHWITVEEYQSDIEGFNNIQYAEGYLQEAGIDPKTVKSEMLPDSLKKAS